MASPTSAPPCPGSREVLRHPDVQVVTEWRANALIRHDGHGFSTYLVEQHGWCLPLAGDRHPVLLRPVRRLCPRQQRAGEASGGRLTVSLGVSTTAAEPTADLPRMMELADRAR